MEEKRIGVVTHFFAKPMVAAVKVEEQGLKVGDKIHFKGHTTDFFQVVESMQVEHDTVEEAAVGDLIGIKVEDRVREHDQVTLALEES